MKKPAASKTPDAPATIPVADLLTQKAALEADLKKLEYQFTLTQGALRAIELLLAPKETPGEPT